MFYSKEDFIVNDLGKRLSELRTKNSLSQEKLSELIGVSRQAISKWEQNQSYPDLYNLIKLSELYNLSIDDLVKKDTLSKVNLNKPSIECDTTKSNQPSGDTYAAFPTDINYKNKKKHTILTAIGVSLIVVSSFIMAFLCIAFEENIALNLLAFGILLATGIGILIVADFYKPEVPKKKEDFNPIFLLLPFIFAATFITRIINPISDKTITLIVIGVIVVVIISMLKKKN